MRVTIFIVDGGIHVVVYLDGKIERRMCEICFSICVSWSCPAQASHKVNSGQKRFGRSRVEGACRPGARNPKKWNPDLKKSEKYFLRGFLKI